MTAIRKSSIFGYDHVYQITADRGICFYTAADCLVWFTLMCVLARRYRIKILCVCLMLNHYHIQLQAPSARALSAFMRDLTALFARKYNKQYGLSGSLVGGQFRNAGKQKEQRIRENYYYICNNPVEKKAVKRAELYRWNFLAYMETSNPFSDNIRPEEYSETLEQVLAAVRTRNKAGRPVDYLFFNGLYRRLSEREKRQAVDYIITEYNVIDYDTVKRKLGNYEQICEALSMVSGAEHDLKEEYVTEDYRHYYRMIRLALREGYDLTKMRLKGLPLSEQCRLANLFQCEVGASRTEISKFLHIPF